MSTSHDEEGARIRVQLVDGRFLSFRIVYVREARSEFESSKPVPANEQPHPLPKWPRALSLRPDFNERRN